MKNILILFLMLIAYSGFSQTEDYNIVQQRTHAKDIDNKHAFVYELGPDTLDASGGPDTLIIEFDQIFYGWMNLFLQTKQIGDLAGSVSVLMGCDGCDYELLDSGSIPTSGDNASLTTLPLETTKIMIQYIAATGEGVISGHVVLKPL